jgi:hypothetical protein
MINAKSFVWVLIFTARNPKRSVSLRISPPVKTNPSLRLYKSLLWVLMENLSHTCATSVSHVCERSRTRVRDVIHQDEKISFTTPVYGS